MLPAVRVTGSGMLPAVRVTGSGMLSAVRVSQSVTLFLSLYLSRPHINIWCSQEEFGNGCSANQ